MVLYFLRASSGAIKIDRTTDFDKRLSAIRRATSDGDVEILGAFHGTPDFTIELEKSLHTGLAKSNHHHGWFHDAPEVRAARERLESQFNSVEVVG